MGHFTTGVSIIHVTYITPTLQRWRITTSRGTRASTSRGQFHMSSPRYQLTSDLTYSTILRSRVYPPPPVCTCTPPLCVCTSAFQAQCRTAPGERRPQSLFPSDRELRPLRLSHNFNVKRALRTLQERIEGVEKRVHTLARERADSLRQREDWERQREEKGPPPCFFF